MSKQWTHKESENIFLPTPEMAAKYLTQDQIKGFEGLAKRLEESFGPPPEGLYVAGWLWIQVAQAQRRGVGSMALTDMLDNAYFEMINTEKDPENYL